MRKLPIKLVLAMCASTPMIAQELTACTPAQGLPASASCYTGTGAYGSPYLVAMPGEWNGTLIVFNQGLTPVPMNEARFLGASRLLVPDGYAVAASGYHRPIAREAARDTEDLRQIFVRRFGRPRRTVAHGLSFGGLVTSRLIELYGIASDGTVNYHGAAPGCGMLAGSVKWAQFYLDIRAVYQYHCRNHPRPDEPQYELWRGLPARAELSDLELTTRVNSCTGLNLPPAQRSSQQSRSLSNILNVTHIAENALLNQMRAATFAQSETVNKYLGGKNPASNREVIYSGSTDDEALNRGIARYSSDSSAVAALSEADDPTGKVTVPLLSMHAADDRDRFVEQQSEFKGILLDSGSADLLVQIYTSGGGHCNFTTPENVAHLRGLLRWVETGAKPSPEEFGGLCNQVSSQFPGACRFDPAFQPSALPTVMYSRQPEPKCARGSTPRIQAVVSAASFRPGLATNSIISVFGSGWTSDQIRREALPLDLMDGRFPAELACIGLRVGGVPAPLLFVTGTQINAQVPTKVFSGPVNVEVLGYAGRPNESRASLTVPAGEVDPALFLNGRHAAAQHTDGRLVDDLAPARPGDVIQLYGTGFGLTEPVYQAGEVPHTRAPLKSPIRVTIGGRDVSSADLLYAGLAPGWVSGLYEFTIRVPASTSIGSVPILVHVGNLTSQAGATILVGR